MKWIAKRMLVVLVGLYIALIVLALVSDKLIFQPQPSSYTDESLSETVKRLPQSGRFMHIISGGERISAFYLPNAHAKYTLLFSHGNAEDIGQDLDFLRRYYEAGFTVFTYDYRGYGTSTGRPSERGVYEDVNAAYDYLTRQLGVPAERIISTGRSVGCAPAIHLAATRPVKGLIAESPFLSAFRVLTRIPLLPWDKFNNLGDIRKVHVPVLIIHGRNDEVVPFWHGERLFQNANAPKRFLPVEGAGHNDVLIVAGEQYFRTLREFAGFLN